MTPAQSQHQSVKCHASVPWRNMCCGRMKWLTFSPLALKTPGSSVVLQTRCKSVVLPAFDLPRTRILKWPMRSKCFWTFAGSRTSAMMSLNNEHTVMVTRPSYYSLASLEPEARCLEFLNGRAIKNLLKRRPGAILAEIGLLWNQVERSSAAEQFHWVKSGLYLVQWRGVRCDKYDAIITPCFWPTVPAWSWCDMYKFTAEFDPKLRL